MGGRRLKPDGISRPVSLPPSFVKIGLRLIAMVAAVAFASVELSACSGGDRDGGDAPGLALESGVAYVKRDIPLDDDGNVRGDDVRDPYEFTPGAALFLRNRLAADSPEHNITERLFAPDEDGNPARYDVKDVSVSYDGTKLLFALHGPKIEDADDDEQHTWDIYQYDIPTDRITRLTGDSTDVNHVDRSGEDVAPRFLRDGRIVFSSTRQKRSQELLLDEGKPPYPAQVEAGNGDAVNLHVMDADGGNIRQLTFNQSHDLDPYVLTDGRIVFTRWDNAAGRNRMSLYTINPDGTELSMLYGYDSHDTGPMGTTIQFVNPVQAADGTIVVNARPFRSDFFGGDLLAIDAATHSDVDMHIDGSVDAIGQGQAKLVASDVRVDDKISPGGRFISAFPLLDGTDRLLVGYHQCLLEDAQGLAHPCTPENLVRAEVNAATGEPGELHEIEASYGLWLLDPSDDTMRPLLIERDVIVAEAVPVLSRAVPAFIPAKVVASTNIDECACRDDLQACSRPLDGDALQAKTGIVDIRTVYDLDGVDAARNASNQTTSIGVLVQSPAAQRGVRFIRLEKPVSMPDDDVFDFDRSAFGASNVMREILGYGVVEPDGSVKLRVPADVAFTFSLLDAQGRRITSIPRHENWLQVQAGETLTCHGCHNPAPANNQPPLPHGRLDVQRVSAYAGAPFPAAVVDLGAEACETMAETATRHDVPNLSPDLLFTDIWTDPSVRAKDASVEVSFLPGLDVVANPGLKVEANVDEGDAGLTPDQIKVLRIPVALSCLVPSTWNALCRTVINYESHIQPIWERTTRRNNKACVSCHSRKQVGGRDHDPVTGYGQLELTSEPSTDEPLQMVSFRELLFPDREQILNVDGVVEDRVIREDPALDANGNPQLDGNGNPVTTPVYQTIDPPMSGNGANASTRFFQVMETTNTADVHYQALLPVELKLISEWLDIGAQYYNNPFDAPEN